jgi:pimeloyl-ACP methyl ester carboxylesterase
MNKVISKDGTEIAYDRLGNGPAMILVDGALCSRKFGPTPKLAPILAKNFTVYAYDRRGRGDSGNTLPYSKVREVEDIAALINEAGGSAYVTGFSSGAALALEAAASALNITKLALYEPPFMVDKDGHKPPPDHEEQLKRLIAADRRGDAVMFFMRKMVNVPAIFTIMMRLMFPVWKKLKAVAHTLPHDAAVMGDFSLPADRAALVSVPTLAMAGSKTDVRLLHATDALAKVLPNVQHRILKGQTHNVSASAIAPVLVEFFSSESVENRAAVTNTAAAGV